MIRLWLSRGTQVPIHEQLSAQLTLGILSRRLAPGERLPSVRVLARRLQLHPNTVSAVYQALADRGWVNSRHGSGVFVRHAGPAQEQDGVDLFVRSCFEEGLARGFSLKEMWRSVGKLSGEIQTQQLLVVDSDPCLAGILAAELGEAISREISFAGSEQAAEIVTPQTCVLVSEASASFILTQLKPMSYRIIRLKSMQDYLIGRYRPTNDALIAVASRSRSVLRWASTLFSALGFSVDSLLLRNPSDLDWQDGLAQCDLVITDVVTAPELSHVKQTIVFRIVADDFIPEIRALQVRQNSVGCPGISA